jgi:molybdate/tungstate transport system substrate-binding protein
MTALVAIGCSNERSTNGGPLVVFNAGSLARPMRAALDTFAAREGITTEQESAGSLETARKLTELGKIPDIIALADEHVIPSLLMPDHATWYVRFARNRMVVAYTDRSQFASEITAENWWEVLSRPGVQVARSDPNLDPNGYRTLLVWQLAEKHYGAPNLAAKLLTAAPPKNLRPNEAALVALLEAGEMDYIWSYESMARNSGFKYLHLPAAIDLGSPADSASYAGSSVTVTGRTLGDSITISGQPIVYAFTIPRAAPHPELALRFASWLTSPDGKRVLRAEMLDVLEHHSVVGDGAPPALLAP